MPKKLSIEEVRERIKKVHGDTVTLDESTYKNTKTKCKFNNKRRGDFWCSAENVINGATMSRRLTIEDCHKAAELKNGKFLSKEYKTAKVKYLWECENGHQWEATFFSIRQGAWCSKCYFESNRLGIEDCIEKAKERSGKFLSDEYVNLDTVYLWECEYGHQWETKYSTIKAGHWCPVCHEIRKLIPLEKYIELAESRGGKFLSRPKILNCKKKYEWKCDKGHTFEMKYHAVSRGRWCPVCGPEKQKRTMMERYGVTNPMQVPELALKAAKSANQITVIPHWRTGDDVNCRASYEIRTVQYFNENKISFDWQPETFMMPDGHTYTPDCYLPDENLWIEIKGYFRPDAKIKWLWFHKEYPNSELWHQGVLIEKGII